MVEEWNNMEDRREILEQLKHVIVGKDEILELVFAAILAGGNILLEDIPGVGKTTLAKSFGAVLDLKMQRVQFTPELIPSDILGYVSYHPKTGNISYEEGAIMCHMFLADEINRASGKTQSALLEAMEEKQITVEKKTYALPEPFFVIATQNPAGTVGTQLLPYSQMDRFMICVSMGYPDSKSQLAILKARQKENPLKELQKIVSREDVLRWQQQVCEMEVTDKVLNYLITLSEVTRQKDTIEVGVSPRGVYALNQMAKAYAWLQGRTYVTPSDVSRVFVPVCAHRVVLSGQGMAGTKQASEILREIVKEVKVP